MLELNRVCNEMSNDEYLRTVRSLNNEQLAFFYHILHLLRTSTEPFYCFYHVEVVLENPI